MARNVKKGTRHNNESHEYGNFPSHLLKDNFRNFKIGGWGDTIVLCVPSGPSASSWHSLPMLGLGGGMRMYHLSYIV